MRNCPWQGEMHITTFQLGQGPSHWPQEHRESAKRINRPGLPTPTTFKVFLVHTERN